MTNKILMASFVLPTLLCSIDCFSDMNKDNRFNLFRNRTSVAPNRTAGAVQTEQIRPYRVTFQDGTSRDMSAEEIRQGNQANIERVTMRNQVRLGNDTMDVTMVDDYVFSVCHALTSVRLSRYTRWIGCEAFKCCESLTHIDLPQTLVRIGDDAFTLSGLTEIDIPLSVRTIGEGAFATCQNLRKITIRGNTSIGKVAFYDCPNLQEIVLSSDIESIHNLAFGGNGSTTPKSDIIVKIMTPNGQTNDASRTLTQRLVELGFDANKIQVIFAN